MRFAPNLKDVAYQRQKVIFSLTVGNLSNCYLFWAKPHTSWSIQNDIFRNCSLKNPNIVTQVGPGAYASARPAAVLEEGESAQGVSEKL